MGVNHVLQADPRWVYWVAGLVGLG